MILIIIIIITVIVIIIITIINTIHNSHIEIVYILLYINLSITARVYETTIHHNTMIRDQNRFVNGSTSKLPIFFNTNISHSNIFKMKMSPYTVST